jgi:uncharacterized protein (DUF58 family)
VGAGSTATVHLELTSISRWPIYELNVLPIRTGPFVKATPEFGWKALELNPAETLTGSFGLVCKKRGVFRLRGLRTFTSFPLGLLNAFTSEWGERQILVYPRFDSITHIDLPTGRTYQPGGVMLASKLGESTEFIGNRDYREGDNIRDIDWRSSARLSRTIVREYREEYFHRVGVILDTFVPIINTASEGDFERAISTCAAISEYMAKQEYVVDLFAAGPQLYHLTSGRSLAYQDQILDILAYLEPVSSEPFQVIEPNLLEHLVQLTTVICVFLDWTPVRQQFVERIRQVSSVKLVIVRTSACSMDPASESEVSRLVVIDKARFELGATEL